MFLKKILSSSVLELFALLIPIIVLPIISAKTDVTQMADYLFIVLLVQTSQQVVDYCYTYIAGRMQKEELLLNFNVIWSAKIILTIMSLFVVMPLSALYIANVSPVVMLAISFGVLGNLFSTQWLYLSAGEIEKYQAVNFLSKSMIFIAIPGLGNFFSFEIFLLFYYFLLLLVVGCNFYYKCKSIESERFSFNLKVGFASIRANYHLFVADFIPQLYVVLPLVFFKGVWSDYSYVALSVAHRFYNAGMTVQWVALKVVISTDKSISKENVHRIFKFTFLFAALKIFAVFLLAGYFIEAMFNENAELILFYLKILAFGFVGAAFYISYGYGVAILSRSEDKFKLKAIYLAFPAAVIVWCASYEFGAMGYALGLVTARIVNGLSFYTIFKRKDGLL